MKRKVSSIHRHRLIKIVATLGPASATPEMIRKLLLAGADVFRLNFSHGTQAEHQKNLEAIRALEAETGHLIGVMADLQGPKLRIGRLARGPVTLKPGATLRLDLDQTPGDANRVSLPHPEIFAALVPGSDLLLDDGKIRLRTTRCTAQSADTEVIIGGKLADRKGVNVPNLILPLSPLTTKDRDDLRFALDMGVDWIALSFVQRPDDVAEARRLIAGRAALLAKMEKPSAIQHLEEIAEVADALMVARGDLGVEMPAEEVPSIQKRIIRQARLAGKPVIVATQMLESMISCPTPTRAEASDVATAVYDGADAVMLSAETASGQYPLEAVSIMDRIARSTEADPLYRVVIDAASPEPMETSADAITAAARSVAVTIGAAAIVTYTSQGTTALRAARERPPVPILCLTHRQEVARRLCMVFGVHSVHTADVRSFNAMTEKAVRIAREDGLADFGQRLVITAGMPFGTPGATNVLRIARVNEPTVPEHDTAGVAANLP